VSAEPPPPTDAPAPGSDDFDPKQHLWDGTDWWSLDKQRWWDGSQWRSVAAPVDASAAPPPPPQVSPDGKFYWDGQRWLPMQTPAAQVPPSQVAQQPPEVQAFPQQYQPTTAPKKGHALRNVSLGCLGLIVLLFVIGLAANGANNSSNNSHGFVVVSPSSSPIDEATYKASAKAIPYVQLEKDPASLAGTVVTYTGQVVQYDSATTTSHLRINVTPDGFGNYNDTIWLDVDPAVTSKVFRDTVIQFWGEVVGAYTYTTVSGGKITIPEVDAKIVQVVG
jgi:hypothetical protein